MTELEMAITLGFTSEPTKNKVGVDPLTRAEIMYMNSIFAISRSQRQVDKASSNLLLLWVSNN
jgi:hypothetical protein